MLRVFIIFVCLLVFVSRFESVFTYCVTAPSIVNELPDDRAVKSSRTLRDFALELQACMKPGAHVKAFAGRFEEKSPIEKLILAYEQLRSQWTYVYDEVQEHQWSEASLNPNSPRLFRGDCEDFATALAAILISTNDLTVRLVICTGEPHDPRHHCYAEVLVASDLRSARDLLERLGRAWALSELVYREDADGIWVALDFSPPHREYRGKPYLIVMKEKIISL